MYNVCDKAQEVPIVKTNTKILLIIKLLIVLFKNFFDSRSFFFSTIPTKFTFSLLLIFDFEKIKILVTWYFVISYKV